MHEARSCCQYEPRGLKILDKLALGARFWTVRVAFALFDRLPKGGDDPQGFLAAFGVCGFDEPAADDHTGPADAAAAMHGAHTTAPLIVPQHVQDGEHELARLGEGAVLDRELMVFNVGEGDAVCVGEVGEVGCVWGELARLCEVDKGANACCEEFVEFLSGRFEWRPGIFAGEESGCCPVRIWDGTWAVCVDGGK